MPVDRSWLTILVSVFTIRWFLASSASQRAKRVGDSVHFKGMIGIRLLFGLGGAMFLYGAGAVAFSKVGKTDWITFIILATFGIACIVFWPEEIVMDKSEVSQSRFIGLGRRAIAWPDVDYAGENPANKTIEVVPKEGKKIVFTVMHAGHDDFLAFARRHCRIFPDGQGL
jgi:hypothetical protein